MKMLLARTLCAIATLWVVLTVSPAWADCDGLLLSGHLCGNPGASTDYASAGTTFPGTHTWTGDALFTSGRPWADAMGLGATSNGTADDDTAAIQAAINKAETLGSGIAFLP